MRVLIRSLALGASVMMAAALPAALAQTTSLKGSDLAEALRQGGYVIYFRHFETGRDTPDQVTAEVGDCWTQRNLNVAGFQQAQAIGRSFHRLRIPVSRVVASPFCRAWQSADLAFGRHERIDALKLPPAKDYSPAQIELMRDGLMPFLAMAPAAGTNLVIMAHDDNLPAAGGPDLPRQGDAVILKPDGGGGFAVVAQLAPDAWAKLARR